MLTAETKRRIDACRDILVGKLPLPTDQVELITLALIYKFMDDLDEESVSMGGKRTFFVEALAPYRWRAIIVQTVSADERMARFADGLEILGGSKKVRIPKKGGKKGEEVDADIAAHLPALFRDIFRNAFLKFRDGRTLSLFLAELNGFAYSHSEELGNAFEYILQCMGAQGDNGQFRTPRHIIDFMVACLEPKLTDKILDPACGTGGFLVSAFKHILHQHTTPGSSVPGDRLSHNQREKLFAAFTGYDINDQMVKLSRVNLFLHQFATPTIHIYDTLTNDARWHEKADLILANPPFMTPKGGVVPHTKFRVPAKKSEVLFTDYIAEHLTPDGRAGIIVPNGIVATTQTAYVKLRRFLVEDSLVAVVSLPAGCFKPYSGVKTSILLLDKKLARTTDKVLFLKITADGFDLGDKRNEIEANDLPEAERVVRAWLTGKLNDDFATPLAWKLIAKKEISAERSSSLSAERFFGENGAATEIETVRLGDLCEKCQQTNPTALGRETFRYIDIDSVDNERLRITEPKPMPVGDAPSRARKLVRTDDVLFSTVRPYLRNIARVPPHLNGEIASTGLAVVRADSSRALPGYLFAIVSDQRFVDSANALTNGAAYPAITENQLFDLEIPLPPLEEQRRIVAEIEGYQQVIDGARQILSAYSTQVEPGEECPTATLGDAGELIGGYAFKSADMTPEPRNPSDLPVVKIGNVGRDGRLDLSDVQYHAFTPELTRYSLHIGDIVVAMTGATVGKAAEVDRNNLLLNQRVGVIRAKTTASQRYLLHILRARAFYDYCQTTAGGGAQGNIAPRQILEYEIPLPSLPEQEKIVAELDAEASRIEAVRGLIPAFEAKIHRVLARVWGNTIA
ncbi:MAG: N-6 DNA methylase [Nibricoccus sp.]